MRPRHLAALAALLSLASTLPVGATTDGTGNDEQALLTGTFGTVPGTDPARPATAAPDDRPLATWMRSEPLELVLRPPLDDETSVSITATPLVGGRRVTLPIDDGRWVTGPDAPGLHSVVAEVRRGAAEPRSHGWLLDVGDRPGSWETRLQMPPIDGRLVAASGIVTGERGHGCLAGFCQEVGYRPPIASLQPLLVSVGEPLSLALDDGSAITHWEGHIEPHAAGSETRMAEASFDEPVAEPALTGLEPDAPGEWLLEVRADYDRERGWQWYLFRLLAE